MGNTTIPAELVAINAIQGTLIADNAITAVHVAQNQIHSVQLAINSVTATQIADSTITSAKIADGTIVTADIADGQITTAKLVDSSVTSAKIAAGTIVGGDIANNAILTQHIDDNQITADQIADNAVGLGQMAGLTRGSIIYGDSAGDPAYLAAGTSGHVLTSDGTDISWTADTDLFLATTGGTITGDLTISEATPTLKFTDTDNNYDATIAGLSGSLVLKADSGTEIGTETIQFWRGDSEAMRIDNTGVGIGTDNPGFDLDVSGLLRTTADAYFQTDVYIGSKLRHNGDVDNYIGFGTDTQSFVTGNSTRAQFSNSLVRFNQEGINQDFQIFGENVDNLFYVDASTDRIGIGTATPAQLLEVSGTAGKSRFTRGGSAGTNMEFYLGATFSGGIQVNSTGLGLGGGSRENDLFLKNDGKVGIGTNDPGSQLEVRTDTSSSGYGAYPAITIRNDNAAGYGAIHFNEGSTQRARVEVGNNSGSPYLLMNTGTSSGNGIYIDSEGEVGIGTTNPNFRLHVYNGSNDAPMMIDSGSANGAHLRFGSSGTQKHFIGCGAGMGLGDHEDLGIRALDSVRFSVGGTAIERMRITASGNLLLGGFTGTESGGSGARWINLDTPGSNTYSSGLLYKINGTVKAYHYVENDNIIHQTTSGVGQRFFAGTSTALTIASDGEIYNDSTRAAGVTLNGFVNLGKNSDGNDAHIVSIRGTGLYQQSSGNRYGNYGTLRLNATGNWTGAARRVLITNGLNTYKFGILSGTGAPTTNPDITSTSSNGGSLVNGNPNFVIDLTNGRIGYQTDSPAFSHHTYGTTEGSNSSSAAGQQHSAVQSSNASAGGYYEKVRYYNFSGNSDHTLVWGNTDSYFSAMVELWAGCSNGGTRNNIYVRGLWHSNHTAHLWDELDRTANVANGDTFTFTAGEYSSGSTASKLTLFHDYGGASFYYGKVKITVITGDYSYYSTT